MHKLLRYLTVVVSPTSRVFVIVLSRPFSDGIEVPGYIHDKRPHGRDCGPMVERTFLDSGGIGPSLVGTRVTPTLRVRPCVRPIGQLSYNSSHGCFENPTSLMSMSYLNSFSEKEFGHVFVKL